MVNDQVIEVVEDGETRRRRSHEIILRKLVEVVRECREAGLEPTVCLLSLVDDDHVRTNCVVSGAMERFVAKLPGFVRVGSTRVQPEKIHSFSEALEGPGLEICCLTLGLWGV